MYNININDYFNVTFLKNNNFEFFKEKLIFFYKKMISISLDEIEITKPIIIYSEVEKKIFIPNIIFSLKFISRNCLINDFKNLFIFSDSKFYSINFTQKKTFLFLEVQLTFLKNDNKNKKFQLVRKIKDEHFYPLSNIINIEFIHKYIKY